MIRHNSHESSGDDQFRSRQIFAAPQEMVTPGRQAEIDAIDQVLTDIGRDPLFMKMLGAQTENSAQANNALKGKMITDFDKEQFFLLREEPITIRVTPKKRNIPEAPQGAWAQFRQRLSRVFHSQQPKPQKKEEHRRYGFEELEDRSMY